MIIMMTAVLHNFLRTRCSHLYFPPGVANQEYMVHHVLPGSGEVKKINKDCTSFSDDDVPDEWYCSDDCCRAAPVRFCYGGVGWVGCHSKDKCISQLKQCKI